MRNKKHRMYTHPMCCFYVKSSDSAVAHGASQCFVSSQGTKRESEARRKNGMGKKRIRVVCKIFSRRLKHSTFLIWKNSPNYVTGRNLSIGGNRGLCCWLLVKSAATFETFRTCFPRRQRVREEWRWLR